MVIKKNKKTSKTKNQEKATIDYRLTNRLNLSALIKFYFLNKNNWIKLKIESTVTGFLCLKAPEKTVNGPRIKDVCQIFMWRRTSQRLQEQEVLTLLMSSGLCTANSVSPGTYSCPLPSGFIFMSSLSVGFSPSRFLMRNTDVYNLQTRTRGSDSPPETDQSQLCTFTHSPVRFSLVSWTFKVKQDYKMNRVETWRWANRS